MTEVKNGTTICITCKATLEDGTVCFTVDENSPLELTIGEGKLFPAVEQEMEGMKQGETKSVTLSPEQAFGPHKQDLVLTVPRSSFSPDSELQKGARVKIQTQEEKTFYAIVTDFSDEQVTLDLNHPLAGKTIVFNVTVLSFEEDEKED